MGYRILLWDFQWEIDSGLLLGLQWDFQWEIESGLLLSLAVGLSVGYRVLQWDFL